MMHTFSLEGKTVSVYPGKTPGAPALYLNTFGQEEAQVVAALRKQNLPDFSLIVLSGLDWNHDMAPWDAPPVFANGAPCTGGADEYLHLLTHTLLPAAEERLDGVPCWRGLAGYSLAGLFALYALYGTDLFSRAACMSGSFWFPGFRDYLLTHRFPRTPERLYFSLGDKEDRTRNPVLRTVRENTEALCSQYQRAGIRCIFQLNPGNHAHQAAQRTAAGIAWLLNG